MLCLVVICFETRLKKHLPRRNDETKIGLGLETKT
jgi:hypothetical protein